MKKTLILMFTCLLLCGCDAGDHGITNVSSLSPPTDRSADVRGLYAPYSEIERKTSGAITAFPLDFPDSYGLRTFGDSILVFSGTDHTTITLLAGENLSVQASYETQDWIYHLDPSLQIHPQYISFYQVSTRETILLNTALTEVQRIPDPANLSGTPIYYAGSNILYYCTDTAIFAWLLDQNLHRTLKELSYPQQELTGVHRGGSVLQCRITDGSQEETLFLSTADGKLLHSRNGNLLLKDHAEHYFAAIPNGSITSLVFGEIASSPQTLVPRELYADCIPLEQQNRAVCLSAEKDGQLQMELYDLTSGLRVASLLLDQTEVPIALDDSSDGFVYLLCHDSEFNQKAVYRWNCSKSSVTDPKIYTQLHFTNKNPDLEGLERCRILAEDIGAQYGIHICIGKDAALVQPWDYDLEPEYFVPLLSRALYQLDDMLSQYPIEVFRDTASHFSGLSICLVREITGTPKSGSLQTAAGIQFTEGSEAYIALTVGADTERTFYHEFFHVMDTHLLGNTGTFDRWDELNPAGFEYDYSYETNKTRNSGVYLQSNTRAFVDTYSMSYPKEDRARIMEYAMLPGNEQLFQTPTMHRKLQTLCKGIRDAYNLQNHEECFLWEQYLQ